MFTLVWRHLYIDNHLQLNLYLRRMLQIRQIQCSINSTSKYLINLKLKIEISAPLVSQNSQLCSWKGLLFTLSCFLWITVRDWIWETVQLFLALSPSAIGRTHIVPSQTHCWRIGLVRTVKQTKQCLKLLKGSYDAISSFSFSLKCYKLFVHR